MNQNNFRGNNGPGGGPQQNMGGMGMGGPGMGGPPNKLRIDSKPDMMNPYFYAQAPPHGMHPPGAALYAQPHSPMHLLPSPMSNGPMYMPPSPPSPMHAAAVAAAAGMPQDFNQKRMGKQRGGGRFNFDMPPQGGAPGGPPNGPMGSPSPYGMYAPQQLPPYMTGPA